MLGSLGSLGQCGCNGGCGQFCRCGNAYGAYGLYGRTQDLATWKSRCLEARARQKAGKKSYRNQPVDQQVADWCSREAEWREAEKQRSAETIILEKAGQDVSLDLPSFAEVTEASKSGPPILPIIAFLAIAGVGGYILYSRGK